MRRLIRSEGVLAAVLQLPCSDSPEVTPSPFGALESLSSIMRLVPPDRLVRLAESQGLVRLDGTVVRTPGGKDFHVAAFRRKGLVDAAAD